MVHESATWEIVPLAYTRDPKSKRSELLKQYGSFNYFYQLFKNRSMISKCSLTTLLLIISAVSFGQNKVEGVWKTQDQKDSLLVSASGQSNPALFVYFPSKAKFLPFSVSAAGDELVHFEPDASKMALSLSADGKTITDASSGAKKVYNKVSATSPVNYKTVAAGPDDFFDFSTSNYYAGVNFYLSSHPGLPFMPNPAFITRKKAKEVKIEKYFARISGSGSVSAQKEFDLVYNFNASGQITSVQVIPTSAGQETDTWTYAYNGDKLQKISTPGRVLQFDNDNWEVDARQQKKVPFIFPMWDYYSSSKPRTATLPYMTGAPLNEYFYNDANQLVRICSKDISEPNIVEHCTEYTYKDGLPVKIVETKRSK
jgi:hypothetical protein